MLYFDLFSIQGELGSIKKPFFVEDVSIWIRRHMYKGTNYKQQQKLWSNSDSDVTRVITFTFSGYNLFPLSIWQQLQSDRQIETNGNIDQAYVHKPEFLLVCLTLFSIHPSIHLWLILIRQGTQILITISSVIIYSGLTSGNTAFGAKKFPITAANKTSAYK